MPCTLLRRWRARVQARSAVKKTARMISSGSRRKRGKMATEAAPTTCAICLVVSGPSPRRKPISTASSRQVWAATVTTSAIGRMSNSLLFGFDPPATTRSLSRWHSGRAPFLRYRLQIALQRILIRGPQHPIRRHQAFGAGLAQGHFEAPCVRMVAELVSQQGLSLRLPFRRRREVLALLNHQPTPVHHLLQACDETVPVESLRRAGRALAAYRLPLDRARV